MISGEPLGAGSSAAAMMISGEPLGAGSSAAAMMISGEPLGQAVVLLPCNVADRSAERAALIQLCPPRL
jgi:hypothetical protein